MENERLVISGIGFFSSMGCDKEKLWDGIVKSQVMPEQYSKVADKNLASCKAYEMEGHVSSDEYITNRKIKRLAEFSKMLCCAVDFALDDAGISKENEDYVPERVGSIVNTVHGPMEVTFAYLDDLLTTGPATARPIYFQQTVNNVACGQAAIENQLKGVSSTIVGASSIAYAIDLLRKGNTDAIVVGGLEELYPYMYASYSKRDMLAVDKGDGEQSVPFSDKANGIVLGEGAGVVILETYESAKRRNAHIYAEILNESVVTDEMYCKTFDEFTPGKSTGFYRAMEAVLRRSNVSAEDIDFISLAANSYKKTDDCEKEAIEKLFSKNEQLGYVASKAVFGETLGASEVMAVISALMCMEKNQVPGLKYLSENNIHSCDDNVEMCLVNSMFVGGNVNSLLLRKCKGE